MKGSLHTDELMGAVVARETGIRTARRISHCFVMDVPGHKDPLIITDAAVNIAPSLADKVDIVQNAIDLGHALGFPEVRVAIMSAMETVNPAVPSTIEAAALCKMAERGQITGGILDGPLALDNAINEEAAAIKHIVSPVAGRANVLVVPDLEAGNMLAKSLSFLAGAAAAGIVLGARVPIILTSRADSVITRLASCAVASLVADARRQQRCGGNPMTEANSMPPELTRSSILKGQKALIVGVANDRSIAWGCAEAMHRVRRRNRDDLSQRQGAALCRAVGVGGRGLAAAAVGGPRPGAGRCAVRGDRVKVGAARHSRPLDRLCAAAGAGGAGHRLPPRWLPDRNGRLVLVIARPDAPRRKADDVRRHDLRNELSRRQRGHRELRDHGPGQGGARIRRCATWRPSSDPRASACMPSVPARWRPAPPPEFPISTR